MQTHTVILTSELLDSLPEFSIVPLSNGYKVIPLLESLVDNSASNWDNPVVTSEAEIANLLVSNHCSVVEAKQVSLLESILQTCCDTLGIPNSYAIQL